MSKSDIALLIYLGLPTLAVAGAFLSADWRVIRDWSRAGLSAATMAALAIMLVGAWPELTGRQMHITDAGEVVLSQGFNGHYYVTLEVNGAPIQFLVDTGASSIVLSPSDARMAGLDPDRLDYGGRAMTANGSVQTARVRLERLQLGEVLDRNVSAVVNRAEMNESLLGMSYLSRFGRVAIEDGRMTLTR